jgi:DNA-binding IclR family transcriptional regulator
MTRPPSPKSLRVGVLSKAFKILEAVQSHPQGLDLKAVSEKTGINKSTAYRLLAHLECDGYLIRDGGGSYMIGMKLVQLGAGVNHRTALREMAEPLLRELWRATEETVNLGVLDGGQVLYIDVLESLHAFRMVSKVGMRRPLYSTALGKSLAAFLPADESDSVFSSLNFQAFTPHTISSPMQLKNELEAVRRQGYALDNEESVAGARCVGAPILNSRAEPVAAISVSGPITRISEDKTPIFAATVMETAQKISARFGFRELREDKTEKWEPEVRSQE